MLGLLLAGPSADGLGNSLRSLILLLKSSTKGPASITPKLLPEPSTKGPASLKSRTLLDLLWKVRLRRLRNLMPLDLRPCLQMGTAPPLLVQAGKLALKFRNFSVLGWNQKAFPIFPTGQAM